MPKNGGATLNHRPIQMQPSISIVIPVKNRIALLEETLRSVEAQSIADWEAVLVDDGCDEAERIFLAALPLRDPRYRLIQRSGPRGGGSVARNQGLHAATADYILFLDSDDCLAPLCLERRLAAVDAHPEADFWVFPCQEFAITPGDRAVMVGAMPQDDDDLNRFLLVDIPWITCSVLWKRAALHRLGGWNETLACWQDWNLHLRACIAGLPYWKADGPPDCFLRRGDHDRIGGAVQSVENMRSRALALQDILDCLDRHGTWTPWRKKTARTLSFLVASRLAARGERQAARALWARCRRGGVVSSWGYAAGRLGLSASALRRLPLLRRLRWSRMQRYLPGSWGRVNTATARKQQRHPDRSGAQGTP